VLAVKPLIYQFLDVRVEVSRFRVLRAGRALSLEPKAIELSGIELANKIKKGQFDTSEITGPGAMILQVWEAALAA
jgi:hypothetical protein